MKARIAFIAVLAAFHMAPGAFGLSLGDLNVNSCLIMVITTDPLAAPSPVAAALGASLPMGITDTFIFEPSIEIFGVNYSYTGVRAVPAEPEALGGFFTPNILIGALAGMRFPLTDVLEFGWTAGADVLIRFPLEFVNNSPASLAGRDPALGYFYSAFKFIYPETRLYLRWQLVKEMGLVFSLRAMYPIFHIWDGEALPFQDQLMIAFQLGFAVRLPK